MVAGSGVALDDLLGRDAADGTGRAVEQALVGTGEARVRVLDAGAVVGISRHGVAATPAHLVDHEANLRALVAVGADRVVALASTGSLRPDWPVGSVVAPDDFFAPWVNPSIHTDGRAHSVPGFDEEWRAEVVATWDRVAEVPAVDGGVYVHASGPRFETPAEIRFYATVGDVIGMTVAAECVLARELGLRYAALCVVDNLANGVDELALTTEQFRAGVEANRAAFAADVRAVVRELGAA